MRKPIVAGVDGSQQSLWALDWAVDEAVRRHLPLRIAHAWTPPYDIPFGDASTAVSWVRGKAQSTLAAAMGRARSRAPDVDLSTELITGPARAGLCKASREADMVVLGSRGLGGFSGLLLGSVSLHVAGRARCLVVVIREEPRKPPDEGEVVVGVDAREPSQAAVGFAFEEASLRGARLRALHAWTHPVSAYPGDMVPLVYDVEGTAEDEARLLSEALAGWREKFPDVEVFQDIVHSAAAAALVTASAAADLLVVGARRRRVPVGMMLGPVNHAVLHHARCPVAVIPEP